MTWREAAGYRMPFGRHAGRALDEIASTDRGLRDLDWLRGQPWVRGRTREALAAYLDDPSIEKELRKAMEGGS